MRKFTLLRRNAVLPALLGFAVVLALAVTAGAQIPGDMRGKIFDENENPLEDVTITITDPDRPDFEQVVTSTKGGRFKVLLANAIVPYQFKLSKDGYQTLTLGGVKIPARKTTNRNFKLVSDAGAVAAAQASGTTDINAADAAKGEAIEVFNKGVAAFNGNDLGTAQVLFETAVEKQPDLGVGHGALARLYLKQEDYAKAVASANRAVALEADLESMAQVLYASHSALGNTVEAEAALAKLKTADPAKASLNIFNESAEAYNEGDMKKAKTGLLQVLSLSPDHGKANYLMGLVYLNEGDNAKAKAHLEKFLAIAPNDTDAATAREMIGYLDG